jgi:D-xylose transport system permease protein
MSTPVVDVPESPAELTRSPSLGEYFRGYLDRVRGGDIGSLPAVFGLIVLVIVFSILRPVFFSAGNFANLLTQGAPITVIAMGLVFVLLLGEIDLSAGFTSGSGSRPSWSPWRRSWPSRGRCC